MGLIKLKRRMSMEKQDLKLFFEQDHSTQENHGISKKHRWLRDIRYIQAYLRMNGRWCQKDMYHQYKTQVCPY
jgi:hypothetical protein